MPTNPWFVYQLKTALSSLYDPTVLRGSPLAALFNPAQQADPVATVRRTLLEGIESLRPVGGTPLESRAWRAYQILRRRYSEGLSQRLVAHDLGLSIRQLQREEKLARTILADHLWTVHNLEGKTPEETTEKPDEESEPDEAPNLSVEDELAWLHSSTPVQLTDIGELIQEVLTTVEPLMRMPEVTVTHLPERALRVPVRAAILRQALLDVMSAATRAAAGGRLQIQAELLPHQAAIRLDAFGGQAGQGPQIAYSESLNMADRLIRLCDGCLEVTVNAAKPAPQAPALQATIMLPAPEHALVMAIDDNADALQLLQRYLAGSRYLFVGTQDARHGLELAADVHPHAILLDVMMPEKDGWTLLGQLREHPKIGSIPIVVCTILPQRELALALGAAGFIRKPVNRMDLLATLDQLVAPQGSP